MVALPGAAGGQLRALGLRECRVRYHEGDLARIEVPASAIATIAEESVRRQLAREFHRLGFKFVTIDLKGYRTGSLNEGLTLKPV